jgi:hypothetical protein
MITSPPRIIRGGFFATIVKTSIAMINTTDLQEVEVSLPGDWVREDTGDRYSFTVDRMRVDDDRLFRALHVRHADGRSEEVRYALTIEDDYCGVLLNEEEFIIRRLAKFGDGSAFMEWEDRAGGRVVFERLSGDDSIG